MGMLGIMGKMFEPDRPGDRNFLEELATIGAGAEYLYNDSAIWGPRYNQLAINNREASAYSQGNFSKKFAGLYGGLYEALMPKMAAGQMEADRAGTSAAYEQLRGLDPKASALYDTYLQQATDELGLGRKLSGEQMTGATSGVYGDFARRGLFTAPATQLAAGMRLYGAGEDAYDRRKGFADSAMKLGSSLYTQPAFQYGRGYGRDALSLLGMSTGSLNATPERQFPNTFSQLGAYGSDLFNTNYNARAAQKIQGMNNFMQFNDSLMSMGGSLGGAAMGCWVAREVFGEADPRWRLFRVWLLKFAPRKLREFYLEQGPVWAARLRVSALGKRAVRQWMQRRIDWLEEGYAS